MPLAVMKRDYRGRCDSLVDMMHGVIINHRRLMKLQKQTSLKSLINPLEEENQKLREQGRISESLISDMQTQLSDANKSIDSKDNIIQQINFEKNALKTENNRLRVQLLLPPAPITARPFNDASFEGQDGFYWYQKWKCAKDDLTRERNVLLQQNNLMADMRHDIDQTKQNLKDEKTKVLKANNTIAELRRTIDELKKKHA